MVKTKKGRFQFTLLLVAGVVLAMGMFCINAKYVRAQGAIAISSNVHHQNYWDWYNWAVPVQSYLIYNDDGTFTRVEYSGKIIVEDYYSNYSLIGSREIPMELELFGGFFAGTDGNYFVFGQDNTEEDDSKEVIRIVKYSKTWYRVGEASLYGANTIKPFRAASLRMCESGEYLYIRTGHEMYTSSDGLNHQANMTISLHKSDMRIVDYDYLVEWNNFGYCSHSFNQFIKVVDGHLVAVDHGDAYPRAILLSYSSNDAEAGRLKISYDDYSRYKYSLMEFPGEIGANYTGAMVGGFEVSDTHYLVSGCSVGQDANYVNNEVKNVFLLVTSRNDPNQTTTVWLTDYPENGDYGASNTQMVELDDNHFMVMWERGDKYSYGYYAGEIEKGVYVAMVDGEGRQLGQTRMLNAQLSDCKPIVAGNKVVWYVTDDSTPQFYSFSADVVNVEKFVERMYTVALGRTSDPSGKAYWTNELVLNLSDGASISKDFIMSPEFEGRNLSNEKYLDVLYKTFFGRSADPEGKQYWMNCLENGNSREFVLAGFVNSNEFYGICKDYGIIRGSMTVPNEKVAGEGTKQFVSRLYDKVLNRGSDSEGIAYWTQCITSGQRTPMEVAKHFFLSEEYASKNVSDKEYVITLYQTFMGREPDQEGLNYWVSRLQNGATREEALEGFAYSPEFEEIVKSFNL